MRRALAGLPHVAKDGVRQIADDKFEITYDPSGTGPLVFEETLRTMGYRPSLHAPIGVKLVTPSLMVQGQAKKASFERGGKGKLLVGLFVTPGHKLGGEGKKPVVVKLEGPEGFDFPKAETSFDSLSDARKVLSLVVNVGKQAAKGNHEIIVKIRFQATAGGKTGEPEEVTVKLPITVR